MNQLIMAQKSGTGLRLIKRLWLTILILFALFCAFIGCVALGVFGALPSTRILEDPRQALATEIISADGVVLGKFYTKNRAPVNFEDLSPVLVSTLVATEDTRFFDHSGLDLSRMVTIIPYNLIGKHQGASTLSQQLARNLFPRDDKLNAFQLVVRKVKEWIMAVRLEKLYTKEEIMTMYLNTVDFSNHATGIKSAASVFFNKTPDKLNENESALIVGMLQNPSIYNPVKHPNKAKERRDIVLALMKKHKVISEKTYTKCVKLPLKLSLRPENQNEGLATYFREYIREQLKDWAADNNLDLYNDGLKIYTTIDSRMQKYAEEAVQRQMRYMQGEFYREYKSSNLKPWTNDPSMLDRAIKQSDRYQDLKDDYSYKEILKIFSKPVKMRIFSYRGEKDTFMTPMDSIKYYKYFLHTGFMTMEPKTGFIKSWVGDVNFKYFKYDHCAPYATRQVGSTFKPFVFATGVENGFSPCYELPNTPVFFEDYNNWSPKNYDIKYDGEVMSLKKGLATSTNRITARLMMQVGIKPVVNTAREFGITAKLDPVPSLCLGVADVSLYEMVPAYNAFNNMGTYTDPVLVTKITDKYGRELKRFVSASHVVMAENKDYTMIQLLRGVTSAELGGTAAALHGSFGFKGPMGGKTGTTQDNGDGWFMAIIPQLTGGVWVGGDESKIHSRNMTGGKSALPIWGYFLQKVYADRSIGIDPVRDWPKPAGEILEWDCTRLKDPITGDGG